MPTVITLGEILADFVPEGKGHALRPGGAPSNVAVNLARLGVKSGIISKIGVDPLGSFLKKFLKANKVDTSNVFTTKKAKTGLVLVFLDEKGESGFSFYGDPAADKYLSSAEINPEYIRTCSVFHFGSISMMHPVSAAATMKAIRIARRMGKLVSYDPNVRLNLWKGRHAQARKMMRSFFKYADIIKINEKELKFIFGVKPDAKKLKQIFSPGQLVYISAGAKGCYVYHDGFFAAVKGFKARAVDTTGAGDAFMSGVLYGIIKRSLKLSFSKKEMIGIAVFANKMGSAAVKHKGAV